MAKIVDDRCKKNAFDKVPIGGWFLNEDNHVYCKVSAKEVFSAQSHNVGPFESSSLCELVFGVEIHLT